MHSRLTKIALWCLQQNRFVTFKEIAKQFSISYSLAVSHIRTLAQSTRFTSRLRDSQIPAIYIEAIHDYTEQPSPRLLTKTEPDELWGRLLTKKWVQSC
ncbi:MAG: hypothetical protein ACRCYD_08410 [Plesiomonas sp.]|uniref:hypothetical protein n=1 Tax=Plesiomonas sp. TaxID=2486279 RepID=UPI003F2BB079